MANNSSRIVTGLGVPNTQSLTGTGSPLSVVSASVGAIYTNLADGSLWTKTSGTNTTTGWVAGASAPTVVSISASATASSWNQIILVDATSGAVTVTLPTAVLNGGKSIEVKKIDSTNNAVIVDANAAETIDGELTQTISQQYNNARFISNGTNVIRESVDNGVLAEYGAVQVDNQIFSGSDTFVNSTNGIYAIPSAGVWLLTYELSTDGTGANTTSQVAIHSPTATVVSGSERVRGGGVTVTAPLSCTVLISTTGAATYRLVGRRGGSGSMTIINSALTTSGITWQKIGGYAPIEGQLVDYVNSISTNLVSYSAVGNLTNTWTSTGNIPATSDAVYTLSAGKTYDLNANLQFIGVGVSEGITVEWVDSTNAVIAGQTAAIVLTNASGSFTSYKTDAKAIFTPSVDTAVRLRVTAITGSIGFGTGNSINSSITIKQLGSSAYNTLNTFTGATAGVAGAAGGVLAPTAGQQNEFLRGNGTWSKPTFSGARRFASAGTSIPNTGVDTVVTTGTVDYVVGTDVTTAVANQIAIVTSGYYRCTGSYEMVTGSSTSRYTATIRVNGVTAALGGCGVSVTLTVNPQVTATLFLTAGDIVSLGALQTSGGAQSTVTGISKTYIEVQFLGV